MLNQIRHKESGMKFQMILRIPLINLEFQKQKENHLAGVGAQYDSEVVYHNIKEELVKQGVIYTDMETASKRI